MRDETSEWLNPLLEELTKRNDTATPGDFIDIQRLIMAATMPAAEAGTLIMDWHARIFPDGATARAMDWVRFGQLLRHELGWDDTYPALPDFPETSSTP